MARLPILVGMAIGFTLPTSNVLTFADELKEETVRVAVDPSKKEFKYAGALDDFLRRWEEWQLKNGERWKHQQELKRELAFVPAPGARRREREGVRITQAIPDDDALFLRFLFRNEKVHRQVEKLQKQLSDGSQQSTDRATTFGRLLRIAVDETPMHAPIKSEKETETLATSAVGFWAVRGYDKYGKKAAENAELLLRAFEGSGLNVEGQAELLMRGLVEALEVQDLDSKFPRISRFLKGAR